MSERYRGNNDCCPHFIEQCKNRSATLGEIVRILPLSPSTGIPRLNSILPHWVQRRECTSSGSNGQDISSGTSAGACQVVALIPKISEHHQDERSLFPDVLKAISKSNFMDRLACAILCLAVDLLTESNGEALEPWDEYDVLVELGGVSPR